MKEVLSAETKRKLAELEALKAAGVDNWEGNDFAFEDWTEEYEDSFTDDQEPEPKSQWQPIETAQKIGVNVLLTSLRVDPTRYACIVGFYDCSIDKWCAPHVGALNGSASPTHWMPLPPPQEEEK